MGHEINYDIVNTKKEILSKAHELAFYQVDRREDSTASYNDHHMTIHDDIICSSYDKAIEKVDQLTRQSYDDHAVRFYDTSNLKASAAMERIVERIKKQNEDLKNYDENNYICNRKSKFITCPNCESKLSNEFLKRRIAFAKDNICPLCRTDMRSKTIQNRIEKYHFDIEKLRKQYKELDEKRYLKAPIHWLLKVDIHN